MLPAVPPQRLEEHCRTSPVSWHTCPVLALGPALGQRLHRDLVRCFSSAKGLLVGLYGSDVPSPGQVPPKLWFCSNRASLWALSGSGCVADAPQGMSSILVVLEGFSPALGGWVPWLQLWQLSWPHCAKQSGLPLEVNTVGHHGTGQQRSEMWE